MRIDVVTIFPDYLAPLDLSLIGAARRRGLLDIRVHDLRQYAHDRHRTVDDTPYGGGAGMVMRPEPWGEALDALRASGTGDAPHLIVPSPSGVPFTQVLAQQLATKPWLAFACGRYEGIDERVVEEAAVAGPVSVVSLGDYVLGGGEVAALTMIEAVTRLVPGVIGNSESLVEESHEDGLLEYPVYTKPARWRDRDVPEVLRSGDHGRIAAWRHEQRLARTRARRPDLLPATQLLQVADLAAADLVPATRADVAELHTLTLACWVREGRVNDTFEIPPLRQTYAEALEELDRWNTWVLRVEGRLVGSVRGRLDESGDWEIGRLMVAPDLHGRGLGRWLLEFAQTQVPPQVPWMRLITGAASVANIRLYRRAGFRLAPTSPYPGTVMLRKPRP